MKLKSASCQIVYWGGGRLRLRIANSTSEHHAYCTAEVLDRLIRTEMKGDVQRRWQTALNEATTQPPITPEVVAAS